MDTRYDVISSRWSSHYWVKMHVFQLFSRIKEKRLDKMMQSNFLFVVLLVKRKKLLIVTVFTWFLVLEKMQDGYHVWWRHRPLAEPPHIKYTSYCRELRSKAFHWSQYRNKWRIHQPQPPPPPGSLYHGEGMTCVYVRGLSRRITANGKKFDMGLLII